MEIRSKTIEAVQAFLESEYDGPVTISRETDTVELTPPYAVVRVSSAEPIAPGEPVWMLSVIVAVLHDSDTTTAVTAETQSAALFNLMDEADFQTFALTQDLHVSAVEAQESDVQQIETKWLHATSFMIIAG